MKKIALYILPITLGIFLVGFLAQAQTIPTPAPVVISNVSGLLGIVQYAIKVVYWLFFSLAVLFILFAAYTYLFAGGDPAKVKKANTQLIYAVVAVAVALLAYGFSSIISSALTSA